MSASREAVIHAHTPNGRPEQLVVEVTGLDDSGVAVGRERDTRAVVRFVPHAATAERIRQAQGEDSGIVAGMEHNFRGISFRSGTRASRSHVRRLQVRAQSGR